MALVQEKKMNNKKTRIYMNNVFTVHLTVSCVQPERPYYAPTWKKKKKRILLLFDDIRILLVYTNKYEANRTKEMSL